MTHRTPPRPPSVPRAPTALLRALLPAHLRDDVTGDLQEEFLERAAAGENARAWYWRQAALVGLRMRLASGWGGSAGADGRLALRRLRRDPVFAAVVLLVVGLGVGINAVVLSLARAVLFDPLPFPRPERLALVTNEHTGSRTGGFGVSWGNMEDVAARARTVDGVALFLDWQDVNVTGGDRAHRIPANFVSGSYLDLLGLETGHGRLIREDENRENAAARVALLGHGTWVRLFGADPGVVGRTLRLNGLPYEVVGVLADDRGDLRYRWGQDPVGVYLPLFAAEELAGFDLDGRRGARFFNAVLRLRDGTPVEAAAAELAGISSRLAVEHPEANRGWTLHVESLTAAFWENLRTPVAVLLTGSLLVLLLVGVNLASLFLARALGRRREMGMRRALGAARLRLVGQLLTESLVVTGLGGVLGIAAAWWAVGVLRAHPVVTLPPSVTLALDAPVAAATLALVALLGVALGLGTAAAVVRDRTAAELAGGVRGGVESGGRRARGALVVAEVALALVLLVGAGLMIESFRTLRATPYGFRTERLLLTRLEFRGERWSGDDARRELARTLTARGENLPGVEAAFVWGPNRLGHGNQVDIVAVDGRWETHPGDRLEASRHLLRPGTLEKLGIALVEGRDVRASDGGDGAPVALVSSTLARSLWPGESAVGRRFESREAGETVRFEVVGVVADARHRTRLNDPFGPQRDVYYPFDQDPTPFLTLALRMERGDAVAALSTAVRDLVADIDPDVPVDRITTMEAEMRSEEARNRLTAALVGLYAALATVLASLGVYGVLAQSVRRQRRDIGVRMALGSDARREWLRALVGGGRLALAGTALGLLLALAGSRLLGSALYGIEPWHPAAFGAATAVVLAVGTVAAALPARRAAGTPPAEAMRAE